MCLVYPDEKPLRKWGVGYKSVKKRRDGTYTNHDNPIYKGTVTYPLNKWYEDPKPYGGSPDDGFHISLDRDRMEETTFWLDEVVIKVRFRKVIATQVKVADSIYGHQVVAREIMNLGEVE